MLDDYEGATGDRPAGCPWAALDTPFVAEIIRARNWRECGELDQRYPHGVPNVIVDAIDVYDAAFNATQVHDMREDRERREQEARDRETQRG